MTKPEGKVSPTDTKAATMRMVTEAPPWMVNAVPWMVNAVSRDVIRAAPVRRSVFQMVMKRLVVQGVMQPLVLPPCHAVAVCFSMSEFTMEGPVLQVIVMALVVRGGSREPMAVPLSVRLCREDAEETDDR